MKWLIFALVVYSYQSSFAQWDTKDPVQFQKELDEWYTNPETTALPDRYLKDFVGLNYYPINPKFRVNAEFVPNKKKKNKKIKNTTGSTRIMEDIGWLQFAIDGEEYKLIVLQSKQSTDPEYADYVTVAFRDQTNGELTYKGGRYLGFRLSELENNPVVLDFNLSYNPSCAYNSNYSCPIPPRENVLPIAINAGTQTGIKLKN